MKPEQIQMAVYPWITLKEPLTIAGVDLLPRDLAIERAGSFGDNVAAGTSYFRDHYLDGASWFAYDPLTLRALEPSVVLLNDVNAHARVEIATLVWFMSVLFANDSHFKYANATTFQHFYQRIGGDPSIHARRARRMHGSTLAGSLALNVIDVRPQWCGEYHDPDPDMLWLLESVIDLPDAEHIRRCIDALVLATTDDDTQPEGAEHGHFARAVERLLHRSDQTRKTRDTKQRALGQRLLSSLLPRHRGPWQIMEVRDAMRDQRNAFWRPEDRKNAMRPFESQIAIRPNFIAFHATTALLVASVRDILKTPLTEKLETYVQAVEEWISAIQEDDPRPPEEAADLQKVWSGVKLGGIIERHMREYTEPAPKPSLHQSGVHNDRL